MTEVALFTERREIVQVTDAAQAKERLLDALRTITQTEAVDVVDTAAESLLAELAGPSIEAQADHQDTDPQADDPQTILNSTPGAIPHPPAA